MLNEIFVYFIVVVVAVAAVVAASFLSVRSIGITVGLYQISGEFTKLTPSALHQNE